MQVGKQKEIVLSHVKASPPFHLTRNPGKKRSRNPWTCPTSSCCRTCQSAGARQAASKPLLQRCHRPLCHCQSQERVSRPPESVLLASCRQRTSSLE
eukprot:747034-Hanusia_phi.AAC.2